MIVFHTDLDDTLIYNRRTRLDNPNTCIEICEDKPLSFMLDSSKKKLDEILQREDVLVVPTTARNVEQFYRINLPKFKYVLTSNGGILLKDGQLDLDWYIQSLAMAESCDDLFLLLEEVLKSDEDVYSPITFNNSLFLRTRSDNPEKTIDILKKESGYSDKVLIYNLGRKIYVYPAGIDKNSSIERFKNVIKRDYTVLADDSMHNYSDNVDAFLTTALDYYKATKDNVKFTSDFLSEYALDFILNFKSV